MYEYTRARVQKLEVNPQHLIMRRLALAAKNPAEAARAQTVAEQVRIHPHFLQFVNHILKNHKDLI